MMAAEIFTQVERGHSITIIARAFSRLREKVPEGRMRAAAR
jgi:hypothetical protein